MRASLAGQISIMVLGLVPSLATHAGAQRISRSPLAIRMKGRISPRTDTTETGQAKPRAVVPLIAPVVVEPPPPIPAKPPEARYSFNLGPNVTSAHSDWEAGIGLSFA